MLEVTKDGDHGVDLSLELSIGGCYKETGKTKHEESDDSNNNKNVCCDVSEAGFDVGHVRDDQSCNSDAIDEQQRKKREFHALRRQEARRKKAEKQKRSILGKGIINGLDKAYLETEQFQGRVKDRENRENEKTTEDFTHKNVNDNNIKNGVLNVSLNQENLSSLKVKQGTNGCVNGVKFWAQSVKEDEKKNANSNSNANVNSLFQPVASRSFRPYQNGNGSCDLTRISSLGFDSERDFVKNQRPLERTSSAFSDYQSTSQKGRCCSPDTGSLSNYSQRCQHQLSASTTGDTHEHHSETSGFSKEQTADANRPPSRPRELTSSSSRGSSEATTKPPNPQTNKNQGATTLPRMPLVSTTGNGPNGKTVNGFLYRYTKMEVSIVCVCHGSSFSPAGFVEHAGGIDVSHPLRHITIVPSFV